MTNYLIVVPRGNTELFELLSVAFRGHTGFNVVIDRRGPDVLASPDGHPILAEADVPQATSPEVDAERRGDRVLLGPDEIVVVERAERAERADRPVPGGVPRAYPRIPVRRRRAGRTPLPTGSAPSRPARLDGPARGDVTVC